MSTHVFDSTLIQMQKHWVVHAFVHAEKLDLKFTYELKKEKFQWLVSYSQNYIWPTIKCN
jgi:hypothetical protein